MLRSWFCLVAAIALTFSLAGSVYAFPTDAIAAPVPEVLPARTYEVQFESHGVQVLQGREYSKRVGVQFGLGDGWEVGFDQRVGPPHRRIADRDWYVWDLQYDPAEKGYDRCWLNLKKQLIIETDRRPALSYGRLNIGGHAGSGDYLVMGKHIDRWQLCLGWTNVRRNRVYEQYMDTFVYEIVGYQLTENWKLWAEHISRGPYSTNFAFEGRVTDNLYLTAGWMRANNSIYDHSWIGELTYRGDW
jgi:hypothetical protein